MQTDDFKWEDAKAAENVTKHGVSFEDATFAFDDADGVDEIDDSGRFDEVRFKLTASVGQRLLVVIDTERATRKRIISAREAEPHEHARHTNR